MNEQKFYEAIGRLYVDLLSMHDREQAMQTKIGELQAELKKISAELRHL